MQLVIVLFFNKLLELNLVLINLFVAVSLRNKCYTNSNRSLILLQLPTDKRRQQVNE